MQKCQKIKSIKQRKSEEKTLSQEIQHKGQQRKRLTIKIGKGYRQNKKLRGAGSNWREDQGTDTDKTKIKEF